ncbi:exodeoxyribonuclease VII large subunit [Pseudochrobactrum sp. AO18b]|uniref:exodeoxyribonuclease VII large subunit n=1 Tax=Pseudochrobactrum sp. AO18b TaxID=1201036 RepID=UPI00039CE360|nr:exodeoxyribonuclease VII large subunit [Pseudochrobactrum sp. AO18b]
MSFFPDSPDRQTENNATNVAEYSVSEISGALKRTVEDTFSHVRVRGEISGYRGPHSSGHAYFALKDERARIEAVIWRGSMSRIKFRPEEGMEVIATGKLTTYPGSSKYQIVIEQMEPAGAGALMALLEERKQRLAREGLFDADRKQLLPFMPRTIGVITSPTGAVIRDIIHRITDRFPLHVLVWPVRVQGETTGEEVSRAVAGFNSAYFGEVLPRPDVLIVARGGGSLEDLWGFNDENVVRAVAASDISVISAVGHETDWTLIDLAADIRAPTPTGAAEMAVPVRTDLQAQLASYSARLASAMTRLIDRRRESYRALQRALPSTDQLLALPRRRFDEAGSRLGRALLVSTEQKRARFDGLKRHLSPRLLNQQIRERRLQLQQLNQRLPRGLSLKTQNSRNLLRQTSSRLTGELILRRSRQWVLNIANLQRRGDQAMRHSLQKYRTRSLELSRLMETLSHTSVLKRGFAIVLNDQGLPVKAAAAVQTGENLTLRFHDGDRSVIADGSAPAPAAQTPKMQSAEPSVKDKKTKAPRAKDSGQGTLF